MPLVSAIRRYREEPPFYLEDHHMITMNCTGARLHDDSRRCGCCPACKTELDIKRWKALAEAGLPPETVTLRNGTTIVLGPFKIEL